MQRNQFCIFPRLCVSLCETNYKLFHRSVCKDRFGKRGGSIRCLLNCVRQGGPYELESSGADILVCPNSRVRDIPVPRLD
jgi:hypothetical protein